MSGHGPGVVTKDPRRWWALLALSLAILLVAVDNTILALAIPSLAADLQPTPGQVLWIGDMYSFVLAGLLITMGSVGDRVGRRRLLMIGLAAFALFSVVAAFAPTANALIVARALQGVAGATLMPSTMALIRNTFTDPKERVFAISVWAAMGSVGVGLGPIFGGFLLEHFWWGSVFLVNVPICAVIMVIGALSLRESRNSNPGPLDLVSAALSLVGMLTLVAAIKELAIEGVTDPIGWACLLISIPSLYWFVRRQLSRPQPMINLRLFKNPTFGGAVMSDLIAVFGLIGVYFFLAQQFQFVEGESPLEAGLRLAPSPAAALVGSLLAAPIINRFGRRLAIAGGMTLGASGLALLGAVHMTGLIVTIFAMMLVGYGFGTSLTGTSDAILSAAPPEQAGAAAATAETGYELGAALGIAILGTTLSAWYRYMVEVPPGLPPDAQAAVADSLATTAEIASEFPVDVAAAMLDAARIAFTDAFSLTAIVAAVVCWVGAAVAWRVLPRKRDEVTVPDH